MFALSSTAALPLVATPSIAHQADDPILVAISAHEKAADAHGECVRRAFATEESLPGDPAEIDDHPDLVAANAALDDSGGAMYQAALELVAVTPTTISGVAALLEHVARPDYDQDWMFPEFINEDDDPRVPFKTALMRHVSMSLKKIMSAQSLA